VPRRDDLALAVAEQLQPRAGPGAPGVRPRRHELADQLFVVRGDSIAVARGKPNSDIAGELFLSEATVKTHITRTFAKLDVSNRVQLTIFAYEAGLVTP
jgi:DNA-binding NarL/FixJ family response regulator